MGLTVVGENVGRNVFGYVVLTRISDNAKREVEKIQRISEKFHEAVYCLPIDSLHITLMDWISPLVEYEKDKKVIFEEIFSNYDCALKNSIKDVTPFTVHFDRIGVSKDAIFIIGRDDGEYDEIRNKFLSGVDLIENAKKPPQIIHSTICRFKKEIRIVDIEQLVGELNIDFKEGIEKFELIKTVKSPLLEFELIKEYEL